MAQLRTLQGRCHSHPGVLPSVRFGPVAGNGRPYREAPDRSESVCGGQRGVGAGRFCSFARLVCASGAQRGAPLLP
ncbi:hypothetical protein GGP87_001682 [Salinibacter ruber]|nr:hypothetical protein [Salinibacter ruber]